MDKMPIMCTNGRKADIRFQDGGLPYVLGAKNYQVLRADKKAEGTLWSWTYNHAPMLCFFKGKFYIEYLSGPSGEHIPPSRTLLVQSPDGREWSEPREVFPPLTVKREPYEGPGKELLKEEEIPCIMHQRMGFFVSKENRLLVLGFYGISPLPEIAPNNGWGLGRVVREIYEDGSFSPIYYLRKNPYGGYRGEKNRYFPEYTESSDEGFCCACRELLQNRIIRQQWWEEERFDKGFFGIEGGKAISCYTLPDGSVMGVCKNGLATETADGGVHWKPLVKCPSLETSTGKVWGQRTSDGRYALVYNPTTDGAHRWPLAVASGEDGREFSSLSALVPEISPCRYGGVLKNLGAQYVRGIWESYPQPRDGSMWLSYSVNKEDIWAASVPVPVRNSWEGPIDEKLDCETVKNWNIRSLKYAPVTVKQLLGRSCLCIEDEEPWDRPMALRMFERSETLLLETELYIEKAKPDTGLLIELQDESGRTPVRLRFGGDGGFYIRNGGREQKAGEYALKSWMRAEISVSCADNSFCVRLQQKEGELEARGDFSQSVTALERILFTTKAVLPWNTLEDSGRDGSLPDLPDYGKLQCSVYYIGSLKTGQPDRPLKSLSEEFKHPGAEWGTLLFWSWNNYMEEDEICRQIRLFKKGGVGGFFIHAREGLLTEYMGNEWMNCVRTAVLEAKRQGLLVWLYDEDRWPSGSAAGRVCRIGGDAYRLKGLTLEVCRQGGRIPKEKGLLAAYAAKIREEEQEPPGGNLMTELRRLSLETEPALGEGEILLLARMEISGPSQWFHNEAPTDLMNPEAVACFLRETHERYAAELGEELGATVKGIFTDEPSLADRRAAFPPKRGWMPWTADFEKIFRQERGYDLLEVVPYLYFQGRKSRKTRHDYWKTIGECFRESYTRQIGEWCQEKGIAFTGHFLQEDRLGLCTRVNGSVMPHYQYMQVPGIDWLGEQTKEYLTVKQCTSVAAQLGKRQVLTETYAGTGWQFSFEDQKWIGDFQYALGVNKRCLHLAFYSLEGMRKRDYPPSFSYHNGWWEKNKAVEGYFARLSLMLSQGQAVRDLLVVHPAAAVWSMLGTSPYGNPVRRLERDVPQADKAGDCFQELLADLCRAHYDFDLGDESLLEQYGRVAGKGTLQVGQGVYRAVLIPSMDTVEGATVKLLKEFAKQGGSILCLKPVPFLLEGEETREKLFSEEGFLQIEREKIIEALEGILPRRVSLETAAERRGDCRETELIRKQEKNVLYQLRKTKAGYLLFLVNHNRQQAVQIQVRLSKELEGRFEEWQLLSGEIRELPEEAVWGNGLRLQLQAAESRLYYIKKQHRLAVLKEEAPISLNAPNLLVLDDCRWRIQEGEWEPQTSVWEAQKLIRERLKMRPISINGGAQWYTWKEEHSEGDGTRLELSFCFEALTDQKQAALLLERPEHFEIFLNGRRIEKKEQGFFLDKAFRKLELGKIRQGRNELILVCSYTNQTELENCFLLGNFGVDRERRLTEFPKSLKLGDWTEQGLMHYCGTVTYHFSLSGLLKSGKISRIYFKMGEFSGVGAELRVNGECYEIPWQSAGKQEITAALTDGENAIDVTIYGTPRNMLGPFGPQKESGEITGSAVFQRQKVRGRYTLFPYGLLAPCEIWGETL